MDFVETLTLKLPDLSGEQTVQEASLGATSGLLVDFAAIHAGVTENFNNYTERALKRALKSWTQPYPKPVIMNHDVHSEPIGRVVKARMAKEVDETPYVSLQTAVTDNEAMEKILDGRYLTASVGGKALKATCSICEADWANASLFDIPCEHRRGRKYEGQLATIDMQEVMFREISVVNTPADSNATIRSVSVATDEDLKQAKETAVYHVDSQAQQLMHLTESTSPVPTSMIGNTEVVELLEHAQAVAEAHDKQDTRYHRIQQVREAALNHPMEDGDCSVCERTAGVKKDGPYGSTRYADPGYKDDNKPRYPIDSSTHVRAAWSYINMPKNQQGYSSAQLSRIKSRIKKAAKEYGVKIDTDDEANEAQSFQQPEDSDDDILAAVDSLNESSSEDESDEDTSEEPASEDEEADEEETSEDEDEDTSSEDSEDEDSDEDDPDEEDSDSDSETDADEDETSQDDSQGDDSQEPASVSDSDSDEDEVSDDSESDEDEDEEDVEDSEESDDAEALRAELDNLKQENTKLRSALKRMLAERVVDAKVSLQMVSEDDYSSEVENHIQRSASSLADTLRDLATWPAPTQTGSGKVPATNEGPAPTEDRKGESVETVSDEGEPSVKRQVSKHDQAVNALTGLMNGRIPTR